jgi:hypothetical protein
VQGKKPPPLDRTTGTEIRMISFRGVTNRAIARKLGITLPRVSKGIDNSYGNPDHVESDMEWVSDEVRRKKASTILSLRINPANNKMRV